MAIDEAFRLKWIATQRKFDYPVNAMGAPIAEDDEVSMRIWQEQGIDVDGRFSDSSEAPIDDTVLTEVEPETTPRNKPVMMYRGVPIEQG